MSTARGKRGTRWEMERLEAFLRQARLFQHLPEATLRQVAARFRPRRLERGEILFLAGEPADALHLLAEGRVKVARGGEEGRDVILRMIGPGDVFGAAGGWGESHYPATASALENSLVLRLPSADFTALIRAQPDFALAVITELGARLRETEVRIGELQTQRVERRIAQALLRLVNKTGVKTAEGVELGVPLSRQDLADLSGTTLSTASRTLSAWDQAGIIISGRERVVLRVPHALVAIADDLPGRE